MCVNYKLYSKLQNNNILLLLLKLQNGGHVISWGGRVVDLKGAGVCLLLNNIHKKQKINV